MIFDTYILFLCFLFFKVNSRYLQIHCLLCYQCFYFLSLQFWSCFLFSAKLTPFHSAFHFHINLFPWLCFGHKAALLFLGFKTWKVDAKMASVCKNSICSMALFCLYSLGLLLGLRVHQCLLSEGDWES